MLVILIFKYMLTRSFDRQFRYYCPTEQELRDSKQFSTDVRKNMLGNRFGHPALHADLFTPMVHAGQVPLLSQVYAGKVSNMRMKMQEMGGQKVDAVVSGGIKFAAIQEVSAPVHNRPIVVTSCICYRINFSSTPHCTSVSAATQTGMPSPS
jgi:hypothetical protein